MHPCCAKPENRSEPEQLENGMTVQTCTVCGRRHYEVVAEPGVVGIRLGGARE